MDLKKVLIQQVMKMANISAESHEYPIIMQELGDFVNELLVAKAEEDEELQKKQQQEIDEQKQSAFEDEEILDHLITCNKNHPHTFEEATLD